MSRSSEAHEILRSKAGVLSYLGDISIFDSNGDMINWSRPLPAPRLNISERGYFKSFKFDPRSPSVLTESVRSYLNGNLNSVIAHRLRGEDGVFLGVMTRRINPVNYEKFFASVALGTGAAISMFHADGTLLARYPRVDELIGQNFAKAPLLQQVRERGTQQTLRVQSPIDQTDRLGSAAPLGHYSGVVVATNTVAAALADWREQTRFLVIAATLAAAVIALILFLIIRQITRQSREAQQRLEAERGRLDTALNNMIQGLVTFDASARLVTFNRRYIEMHDLSTDIVKPGCHFRDLMQHRKDNGSFDGDVDAFCSLVMRNIARGQVDHSVMQCPDGRAFLAVSRPLADGGWVATMEDITERRNLEQERDRNYAFLSQIIDHIPSQITVKDVHDRRYLLVNRVAEAQFGISRDLIIGKTAFDIFPKAAADGHRGRRGENAAISRRPVQGRARLGNPGDGPALHHLQAARNPQCGGSGALHHQRRRRRYRAPACQRKDRASGALRRADRPSEPGAVPRADRARASQGRSRPAIRAALYRHRRIQGHQQLARTPCRR